MRADRLRLLAALKLAGFLVLPILPLAIWSFAHGWRFPELLPQTWSLKAWSLAVDARSGVLHSFAVTTGIALATTLLAALGRRPRRARLGALSVPGQETGDAPPPRSGLSARHCSGLRSAPHLPASRAGRVQRLSLLLFSFSSAGRNDLTGALALLYILPGLLILFLTARQITRAGCGPCRRLAAMTTLVLDDLRKSYSGIGPAALHGLSLAFTSGSLTALPGPSGSGKTTTMKLIAGLTPPIPGTVPSAPRPCRQTCPRVRGFWPSGSRPSALVRGRTCRPRGSSRWSFWAA
jgi:ABC-type multidrug transport system fused ATPase/permease subunit